MTTAAEYGAVCSGHGWFATVGANMIAGPFPTSAKALRVARAAWANPKGVQTAPKPAPADTETRRTAGKAPDSHQPPKSRLAGKEGQ